MVQADLFDHKLHASVIADIVSGKVHLTLPISGSRGELLGHLSPLTTESLNDTALIEAMTRWRNQASAFFLSQFEATSTRTKQWLEGTVLSDRSRLLFLTHSPQRCIGHFGFKNLSSNSAEIDNLVRGESGGHPQLIRFAEVALLRWLFDTLKVDHVYGYVVAGNWQALALHASVGFRKTERIPLNKEYRSAEMFLQMGAPGMESAEGLYAEKITLERNNLVTEETSQ